MFKSTLSWFLVCGSVSSVFSQSPFTNCDYFQNVQPNQTYYVYSPGYGTGSYGPNTNCRWTAQAPINYNIILNCTTVFVPTSQQCSGDRIEVSVTGDRDLTNANRYCGVGRFSVESESNRMVIALRSTSVSPGGFFVCQLYANVEQVPCKCGARKKTRIVGGTAASPNEFPMMAGLVEVPVFEVYCGATIIAEKYALSAAHCVSNRNASRLALLVGDNDYRSSNDSIYSALYRISSLIIHPRYNAVNDAHDISIIGTDIRIIFNEGVGPVCLPFKYAAQNQSFTGQTVEATGWGTTEYGGPVSSTLQKVSLNVTSNRICELFYSNTIESDQICTFARNKDTCQSDSGGPLLYTGVQNQLLYQVGIVSFGIGCATLNPSVSTRLTSYVNWIVNETRDASYCNR